MLSRPALTLKGRPRDPFKAQSTTGPAIFEVPTPFSAQSSWASARGFLLNAATAKGTSASTASRRSKRSPAGPTLGASRSGTHAATLRESRPQMVTSRSEILAAADVGDKLSSTFLTEALQSVPSATSAGALTKLRPVLEKLLPTLEQIATDEVSRRSREAIEAANRFYNEELSRLSYLQSLNPAIRDEELLELKASREACHLALSQAKPALEGLRVCIAV